MSQMVEAQTINALLDLQISNNVKLIADVEERDDLGNSDHRVIMFAIKL